MISLLLTERAIISAFYSTFTYASDSQADIQIIKERTAGDVAVYTLTMILTVFLSLTVFAYLFTFLLYIPLPDGICDRLKLQLLEFLLRVSNEYFGNLIEPTFGPRARNRLTRILVSIPYLFKARTPKWVSLRKETIAGVPVRVYTPRRRKTDGLILFIHGGGWAVMKPAYYDAMMYSLIARLGTMVISVDYRMSPEHVYPAAVDDCEAVYTELVMKKFKEYEFNRSKICVMGDSAGGNLGAVLAQRMLRKNLPNAKCQVLIYPVIHGFDLQSPSYQLYYKQYRGTALLNPRMMARWYLLYLGIPATKENIKKLMRNQHLKREQRESLEYRRLVGHEGLPAAFLNEHYEKPKNLLPDDEMCKFFERHGYDPDFAPILGKDLNGLCPAMIVTAGYDILRDEGVLYAKYLQSYGISVLWNHYKAAYHGVLCMPASAQRKQMLDDIAAYVDSQLR